MKILITGLSGSGKTTLTKALIKLIPHSITINGDTVRGHHKDNDFSLTGRLVQAVRMKNIAVHYKEQTLIADFICPTEETRRIFNADYVIFMNTITSSQYADTDALYETPTKVDAEVTTKEADVWARLIKKSLERKFPQLFDILPKT